MSRETVNWNLHYKYTAKNDIYVIIALLKRGYANPQPGSPSSVYLCLNVVITPPQALVCKI